MRARVWAFIIMASAAPAAAQPPAGRLALAEAVAEALKSNPEIAAAERRYDAARQRPIQEQSLPDPMVSAGWNSSGNPLPGAGLGSEPTANIGFMVSQELPYPGKRGARAAIMSREADAEFHQIEAARLSVTSRVKQAYYGLASSYAIGAVLDRNRELLATLLKVSEQRYAVGQAAQQDVIKAQTELSVIELQRQRILQARRAREGELNALLARPVGTPVAQPEDLVLPPFTEQLESLVARAAVTAPMLKREQVMVEASRLGVNAARLDYKPDFALSGGYYYAGSMPAMYEVRFDVTVPLQRKRRAAAVAERLSLTDAAQKTYESSQLALQGRLQVDYEMAATAARLAGLYRDTVLPQSRLAFESSMASYQTGSVDFLSVLTNFAMVLENEMSFYDQVTELHQAISRLEEMSGIQILH